MRNNLFLFLFGMYMLLIHGVQAQRCVTAQLDSINGIRYPQWKSDRQKFEQNIQEHIHTQSLKQKRTSGTAAVYTIPVVVHVIHNNSSESIGGKNISDQQIYDQMAVLNEDYRRLNSDTVNTPTLYKPVAADVQIQFCLAVRDPNGDPTTGIRRIYNSQSSYNYFTDDTYLKSLSYWPSDQYLNIWVCDLDNSVLGYAQFPSNASDDEGPAETDGVVIDYSTFGKNISTSTKYNLGRTTTHEVGHWLDLIHIWGDVTDCSGTDYCADVPNCSGEYYASKSTCSAPVQCSNVRMIQNYMDYSDDACMNLFTADQKTRMHSAMSVSPRRIAIQNSLGCCTTCYIPHAGFTASKTNDVKVLEHITFTDQSSGTITSYSWDFGVDAVPSTATGPGPHVVYYTSVGYKNVSLTTTGPYGTDTSTKNNYILVTATPPQADFFANKTTGVLPNEVITFTDASTGLIDDYQWNFGADAVPSTASGKGPHTVSYSTVGFKTVSLTCNYSVTTSSNTNTKNHYISVVSNDQSELHIYPNPAQDLVALSMVFQDPTKVQLLIYDRLGKKVYDHESVATTVYNDVLQVKAWADGLYIIKVITGDSTLKTWRLLVIK